VLIGDGAYVQAEDSNGMTSLHSAALNGYEEVVNSYLKRGQTLQRGSQRNDGSALGGDRWA
jgi:ankyrin repeat protein